MFSERRFSINEVVSFATARHRVEDNFILLIVFLLQYRIGIVTGFIGIASTVQAMASFGSACFHELTPNTDAVTIDRTEGAALLCLIIGTGLKLFDVLLHMVVPAPLIEELHKEERAAAVAVALVRMNSEQSLTSTPQLVYEKECMGSKAWEPVSVLVSDEFDSIDPPPRLVKSLRDNAFA